SLDAVSTKGRGESNGDGSDRRGLETLPRVTGIRGLPRLVPIVSLRHQRDQRSGRIVESEPGHTSKLVVRPGGPRRQHGDAVLLSTTLMGWSLGDAPQGRVAERQVEQRRAGGCSGRCLMRGG